MAGQIPNQDGILMPGQMSNQGGSFIGGQMQNQNGNLMPVQMQSQGSGLMAGPNMQQQDMSGSYQMSGQLQNSGVPWQSMGPEALKARRMMFAKIYEILVKRQQQAPVMPQSKMIEIVKRLEEGLFRNSLSQDEYLNLSTLESRLHALTTRRTPPSNRNPQYSHVNSPSVGTMIPTPGTSQSRNSSLIAGSAMDSPMTLNNNMNSGTSANSNSGNFLPTTNVPASCGIGGSLTQPEERMRTQMMPTPGFSNTNDNMNLITNNPSYTSNTVESTTASQPLQQKPLVGGGNSRILRNLGTHMGAGLKSTLQASYGTLSGGVGVGNNFPLINVPALSEGYPAVTMSGNSARQLDNLHQIQQPLSQGDGYALLPADVSRSGNVYDPVTSIGSTTNNRNLNVISRTSSSLLANQSNLHVSQHMKKPNSHSIDQLEKLSHPSQTSFSGNLPQSNEHWQFQQQPHQLLQIENQQNGRSLLDNNNALGQSHLPSNLGSQLKLEAESDSGIEAMHSQAPEQLQFSDGPPQLSQNSLNIHSRNSQWQSFPSGPQVSQQMPQILHQDQFFANSESDLRCSSRGVQADAVMQSQWYSKPQDESLAPVNVPSEQDVQQNFSHRITGLDENWRNNISPFTSMNGEHIATPSEEQLKRSSSIYRSHCLDRKQQFSNQQKWLLFLRHARRCPAPEGKCLHPHCITAQKLLLHIEQCHVFECPYPRCRGTMDLINHHRRCKDTGCPVCIPVKTYVGTHLKAHRLSDSRTSSYSVTHSSTPLAPNEVAGRSTLKASLVVVENSVNSEPSFKRVKIVHSLQPDVPETETKIEPNPSGSENHLLQKSVEKQSNASVLIGGRSPESNVLNSKNLDGSCMPRSDFDPGMPNSVVAFLQQENIKFEKEESEVKLESISLPPENASGSKSGKPNIKGVSLIELFTPEEVREHIQGLRQWVGQSKSKVEKNQAMGASMSENSCQLCAVEKLTFEPPPIYCSRCGGRIKRNAMYYTIGAGDTRHWFCLHCHNDSRGETIMVEKIPIPKARLEKKKNDEETEEWWVQCDKCEAWQHQICALFNGRRNDGGQAEYTCPNCYMLEVERGERMPLPQSTVLGAKDLPRTILSDHIENRLAGKLQQERQDRANFLGKSIDEVPAADGIVVRVVSSVDKKLEIKPQFLEIFKEENYPSEFPYKSKVLLFFQNIEGVEVCLFGMYVQEFGSECVHPNNRRVYLSYLDSVKYFRPEIKTISGESLRTYVYHEILIGYLEYCKMRGFASCYIWACPPLKGEDYILYCHPEIQKTPKSDKLREWYLSMLRKAARENIVVERTNLYDHFFVSTGECRAKVTATRLPYFDGDYWPGAAEDMIYQLQEEEDGRKQHKKGTFKKSITKRALKAAGQTDLSGNASKDLMLMHKLGETIYAMREDFIMVHLQYSCTHCCILLVSGNRWVCNSCKTFNLCDNCYEAELKREDRERHPINQKFKHPLHPVEIKNVPYDTKDEDEILESEFFDTRHAFLSLCQGNHYQYDTLRRAKHSSMMVLYYLHNPTVPPFVTQCMVCHLDIETGQGWRCDICPDYDVCNACYLKDGAVDHPHKLTNNPSVADVNAQNKEARQLRVSQLKKMLELLVHASQCRSPQCLYPNCIKVKRLFRHGIQCKVRAAGGCLLCKKMWYLLQLHARACKENQCNVPRCRDLRDHLKRLQQQSDSRRRAAVMEMMRQRASEVAGSS